MRTLFVLYRLALLRHPRGENGGTLMVTIEELTNFIVEAKSRTYVGGGGALRACRPGSRDIGHQRGAWSYLDSYFDGTDFAGQEPV